MTADVMIQASDLSKSFGTVKALDKVTFEVTKGEVVGFLGPNGAGKSTTMRILTCFLSPTSGSARVCGRDVFDEPLAVRQSLGYLPQRAPLYTDMSVLEYLRFAADIRGLDAATFKKSLSMVIEVCGLAQSLHKDIGTLSHGYRQRVGLGQALIHDPQILILDEPTADLDPNEKAEVIRYIQDIGKDRTVLLSTHNLAEVEQACARAIIVSKGRVVADGSLDEIRAKTGGVRYVVALERAGNDAAKAQAAFATLSGVRNVRELSGEDGALKVEIAGPHDKDLRADIFRLTVNQGWTLLELRRDAQSLDAVFRDLTRSDEARDRGREWDEASAEGDDDDQTDGDESAETAEEKKD